MPIPNQLAITNFWGRTDDKGFTFRAPWDRAGFCRNILSPDEAPQLGLLPQAGESSEQKEQGLDPSVFKCAFFWVTDKLLSAPVLYYAFRHPPQPAPHWLPSRKPLSGALERRSSDSRHDRPGKREWHTLAAGTPRVTVTQSKGAPTPGTPQGFSG